MGGYMSPRNCLFSNSGKLGIRRDHPHSRITVKFCMAGGLHEIILTFEFRQNWSSGFRAVGGQNLPFPIDLAIGLFKIVISQQIKEVIANGHWDSSAIITWCCPVNSWLIFVGAEFDCRHALADGIKRIQIREKVVEFSSLVLPTPSPYHTPSV